MQPLRIGDHVRARRFGYWHDAIYVGDDHVLHVWCEGFDKSQGRVRRDSFDVFIGKSRYYEVVPYDWCFEPDEVVRRAQSRLGQGKYDLLRSNCQHFARWCKTNESISDGVERAAAITAGASATHVASKVALAATLARSAVGARGAAAVMSGLAGVTGSAASGIGFVAAAPAAIATAATLHGLRDDPLLSSDERAARRKGRRAAIGGAGAGVGLALGLVHTTGIPGFGAAGIASGLKVLGFGTMLRGLTVVSGIPAAAAVAAAVIVYKHARRKRRRAAR